MDVSESQTSGQDVHIVAHKGEINANKSTVVAKNEINLHTPSQLLTQHANLKADWIGATAQGWKINMADGQAKVCVISH